MIMKSLKTFPSSIQISLLSYSGPENSPLSMLDCSESVHWRKFVLSTWLLFFFSEFLLTHKKIVLTEVSKSNNDTLMKWLTSKCATHTRQMQWHKVCTTSPTMEQLRYLTNDYLNVLNRSRCGKWHKAKANLPESVNLQPPRLPEIFQLKNTTGKTTEL